MMNNSFLLLILLSLLFITVMYVIGTRDLRVSRRGDIKEKSLLFYRILSILSTATMEFIVLSGTLIPLTEKIEFLFYLSERLSGAIAVMAIQAVAFIFYGICMASANAGKRARMTVYKAGLKGITIEDEEDNDYTI